MTEPIASQVAPVDLNRWALPPGKRTPVLYRNPTDRSILLLVPAGTFLAGNARFELELPAYYLGITPVTNVQYKRFVEATGHHPPDKADSGKAVWRGKSSPAWSRWSA